jgi:hypothetical protein
LKGLEIVISMLIGLLEFQNGGQSWTAVQGDPLSFLGQQRGLDFKIGDNVPKTAQPSGSTQDG